MKTVIQELMENVEYLKTMGVTIHWGKYLEKEKEQIIKGYKAALMNPYYTDAVDYYNKTYNQNK